MAKKTVETKENKIDDIISSLQLELNKDEKVVYSLSELDNPALVKDWTSTGSSMLDIAISNRPHGGLPGGKIVYIKGLESSGKSLLCAHICANTQKLGGIAVYIDSESAAAPIFWKSLGVDVDHLQHIPINTVEKGFESIEKTIATIRKKSKTVPITIIFDSVAGATTKAEQENGYQVQGYNTSKSILLSSSMRKITNLVAQENILMIFTNQLRHNVGATGFGAEKWTAPGGKAIPFHSSVIITIKNVKRLKKGDDAIGQLLEAVITKNRMGPPYRKARFYLYYDSGIADYASWIEVLIARKLISGAKGKFQYVTDAKETIDFNVHKFVELMNTNPALKEEIYNKICNELIMIYKDPNSTIIEDVTEDDNVDDVAEEGGDE